MAKLGFTHVVISMPRLIVAALLAGALIGGTQLLPQPAHSHMLQSRAAAVKQSIPYTTAPQTASQPTPQPTPQAGASTPAPLTAVRVTHTVKPAPVVNTAASASVTGLKPVASSPIPASPVGSGGTSTPTPLTTTAYTSSNWAGYMASTGTFTGVSGSWKVPTATGISRRSSYDATWIGIGGVTSGDLIQVGTQDTVTRSGTQSSTAFYELLPSASKTITSLRITQGDAITATLAEVSSDKWTINIADTTSGTSYTSTLSYNSLHSSAEWIEEDPSNISGGLIPLDNFGTVSFTNATSTTDRGTLSLSGDSAQPITLVSSTKAVIASPSELGTDGMSFNVSHE